MTVSDNKITEEACVGERRARESSRQARKCPMVYDCHWDVTLMPPLICIIFEVSESLKVNMGTPCCFCGARDAPSSE